MIMKKYSTLFFCLIILSNISYAQNSIVLKKTFNLIPNYTKINFKSSLLNKPNLSKLNSTFLLQNELPVKQSVVNLTSRTLTFSKGLLQLNLTIDNMIDVSWNGYKMNIMPKIIEIPTDEIELEAPLFAGLKFAFTL